MSKSKVDRETANRIRTVSERLADLTVEDVGEDVALKLAFHHGDGITERNVERVEELLADVGVAV